MIVLKGRVCRQGDGAGCKDFSRRMTEHADVFMMATGELLFPGTLNVNVGVIIPIREHFRIHGREINHHEELQFEVCRINGIWAYRVRPLDANGGGGHGDHILEIVCCKKIPDVAPDTEVAIVLFPRD